jgi:hypothetical protein
MPREFGHKKGVEVFREITEYCHKIGVQCVTVYAFSTENWKRPQREVDAIMKLLDEYLDKTSSEDVRVCFIGDKEKTDAEIQRTEEELSRLLMNLEAESIKDMQPIDVNEEDILPDPVIYDTIRFLIKDLEAEGKIDCSCHEGNYDLRFCQEGIQVYCPKCGATHTFNTEAVSASEDYLRVDSLYLK